jgi:hypothetical protein
MLGTYLRNYSASLQIYKPASTKTVKDKVENLFRYTSYKYLDVHIKTMYMYI